MKMEHVWRFRLVGTIFTVLSFLVVGQLIRFQFDQVNAQKFDDQWELYRGGYRTYFPARGLIYDRSGHMLAGNELVYEVGVVLSEVKNPHTIALTLNVVLGLDYAQVYNAINNPPPNLVFLVLANSIPKVKVDRMLEYKDDIIDAYASDGSEGAPSLRGLDFIPRLKRVYPEEALASNIIGFVGQDREKGTAGFYGVESKYDSMLAGAPVRLWVPNDPKLVKDFPKIPDGATLILTIDRQIQSAVEEILDNAIDDSGAESGTIVVLEPKTGEVLAMASTPRIDLNNFGRYESVTQGSIPFNRAISQAYEPGSVYKVLTMAAALDKGVVNVNTEFLDTGSIEVGGHYIYNWNRGAWGPQTMLGCMQHSLNVCLAWIAIELGANNFYSYMQAFGIGHTTGIDLAGEANGRLKIPGDADWYQADLATNSFGQGVATTPLQMASAISALANEGKIMVPHVVKAFVFNGRQYETEPRISAMPISAQTAYTITEMLAVSLESEASTALVEGYRVAGKTGTGEIPTPYGYTSGETNASFAGWGPVDDPRFIVYIWLEKPKSSVWGSEVAAPIFPKVVDRLVVLMNIPPDRQRRALYGQ